MDVVKEDMAEVEVTEKDTVDRNNWRRKIRCGDPWWEKPKEEEEDCPLDHSKLYTSPPGRPVHSHTNSASLEIIQPWCNYYMKTIHLHNIISIPVTHFHSWKNNIAQALIRPQICFEPDSIDWENVM